MKHTAAVTAILVTIFVVSQLVGLGLIAAGTDITYDESGKPVVAHEDTAIGPRPETTGFGSFLYLVVGLAVATVVLLILIKFNLSLVWKLWVFVAVWLASTVSLGSFMPALVAAALALILSWWKIWRPNIIIHNITEVLVYSGISLLIVPILDLFWVSMLLIVIAIYDAYAVWRSKHMITMAKFQTESKLFAGLLVPYSKQSMYVKPSKVKTAPKLAPSKTQPTAARTAILGGGDIAFPLLYIGVVMDSLMQDGFSKLAAFSYSMILVATAATALLLLFVFAKKDTFYPAMPFLAAGCFAGFGILQLVI